MSRQKTTLGLLLCAVPFCVLGGFLFADSDRGAYLLLAFAYLLFATPFVIWKIPQLAPFKWGLGLFSMGSSLGLVSIILLKKAHLAPLYPLATTLAYLILLVCLLLALQRWIFSVPHSMRLHFQKRYLIYGAGLVALLFATTTMDQRSTFGPHFQLGVLVWILLALLIVNWFLGQWRMVKALEAATATAELTHLKSQIQPHFLFNTLNNLYGLAREKSDLTADMILKLSDLLRYGLYQANQERVTIAKEIEYLNNYLALQKLRHASGLEITFETDVGTADVEISPLILIPLVENAFKHGADQIPSGAFIHLELRVKDAQLQFTVENNVSPRKPDSEPGLGLQNLRKRLLLIYPNRHEFSFTCGPTLAKAELKIKA